MGLNLETLIGILVVLILLILADGIRRMLRERSGRLKVRIDPRVKDLPDIVEAPNRELVGGPRVVHRGESSDVDEAGLPEAVQVPPVVMEAEPVKAPIAATQQDLFGAGRKEAKQAAPVTAENTAENVVKEAGGDAGNDAGEVVSQSKPVKKSHSDEIDVPAPKREEILEVIVLHMVANQGVKIPGHDLLQHLLEQGMRFGEMNIFHRHSQSASGKDELQFSMANALEPGTFDIDTMEENTFRAVTFFMKLPGPSKPLASLDKMLSVVRQLSERCDAELRDEAHSVLTPQTIAHLRQRVQDFERRQHITNV